MKHLIALLVVASFSSSAWAQANAPAAAVPSIKLPQAIYLGAIAGDGASTFYCLQAAPTHCSEGNPLMRSLGSPGAIVTVSTAISLGTIVAVRKGLADYPKAQRWAMWALAIGKSAIVVNNLIAIHRTADYRR